MPRAGHDAAFQLSLAQGTSPVQASIVDGIERSINIEQRNPLLSEADGLALPCRNVVSLRRKHKLGHANPLMKIPSLEGNCEKIAKAVDWGG
jgi:hypothetical protein